MIAKEKMGKIDSLVLANYILKHYGPMSHLKLQKLLYYCDAYCLAFFGEELISDKFEAWVHGPVSRKVFNELKGISILYADMEYSPIEGIDEDKAFNELPSEWQELLKEVLDDLNTMTGLQLERKTHGERPWIEARKGYSEADKCEVEISKETTAQFYRLEQQLNA